MIFFNSYFLNIDIVVNNVYKVFEFYTRSPEIRMEGYVSQNFDVDTRSHSIKYRNLWRNNAPKVARILTGDKS